MGALLIFLSSAMTLAGADAFTGEMEVGGVANTGNTETESLNIRITLENDSEKWRNILKMDSYYSSGSDGSESADAQKLTITGNSAYKYSKRGYVFTEAGYENDRFSGYDYRVHELIGLGRTFIISEERISLSAEAGPGGRHSKLSGGARLDELIFSASARLRWSIGASSEFSENASVKSGGEGTVVQSVTAVKANIAGAMSMKLSFDVKWNSDAPDGKKQTDTITSITFVHDF